MAKENEVKVVKKETAGIMLWANNLVVASAEDYKSAFIKIAEIKSIRKRWSAYWLPLKDKAYATYKDVLGKLQEGTNICDAAERRAKAIADSWRAEQEQKAQEKQQKLQAIVDEKARRERERLEKEAAKLKTPEKKAERLERAAEVIAPVITTQPPIKVDGVSIRINWKAKIVSMDSLIAAATPNSAAASLLIFDQKAANKFAISTKGKVPVPGIEFYTERIPSVRKNT